MYVLQTENQELNGLKAIVLKATKNGFLVSVKNQVFEVLKSEIVRKGFPTILYSDEIKKYKKMLQGIIGVDPKVKNSRVIFAMNLMDEVKFTIAETDSGKCYHYSLFGCWLYSSSDKKGYTKHFINLYKKSKFLKDRMNTDYFTFIENQ
jgi:hypothetical protein